MNGWPLDANDYTATGCNLDAFALEVALSAAATTNGGVLIVKDGSDYVFPNGSKESVYMTGTGSSVQLSKQDTLECDNDYYQNGGTLQTDDTACTLQDGSTGQGTATVAGGAVTVDTAANTYSELDVKAAALNFGGQLAVSIQGYANPKTNTGQQDKLKVVGGNFNLSPQGTTSLFVNDYGTLV